MKLLKIFLISLFVSLSFFVVTHVFAEKAPVQKVVTAPNVHVYNTKVVSQKDNVINISADIVNGEGLQKNLTYSVGLVNGDKVTVHKFDSTEIFSINSNSSFIKDIAYNVPSNLVGDYAIFLKIKDGQHVLGIGSTNVTITAPSKILGTLKNIYSNPIIYIIVGVLVVAGAIVYFIKLKKKQNEKINQ